MRWMGFGLAMAVVACGAGEGTQPDADVEACYAQPAACVDPEGAHFRFVVDSVELPTSAAHARELGLDLDGDPNARPDNTLGAIVATIASQRTADPQAVVDREVATGATIALIDVQATAISDARGAGAWVLLGADPMPPPCADPGDTVCGRHLAGDGRFSVDPATPPDALMPGAIDGGRLIAGPGRIALELPLLGGDPLTLNLIGARIEVTVAEAGLTSGRIGGALTEQQIEDTLVPAVFALMNDTIAADCPGATPPECACIAGSTGETVLALYDDCSEGSATCDCRISPQEIQQICTLADCGLFAPDVDLLDETGAYNPRDDGVKDGLSFGIGFTAVPATFE